MSIKMRVNKEKESECFVCKTTWLNTHEMYDLRFESKLEETRTLTLCKTCVDELFNKTLRASCLYNSRIKNKEDMERIRRAESKFMPKGQRWTTTEIIEKIKPKGPRGKRVKE